MSKRKYDFAGWVTKNDILCADGVVIKHDAFKHNDGEKVPLVWNHDYNNPTNVLGHIVLENRDIGVYGYGFFNETDEAQNAKEMIRHGDISSMSIGARKIKRMGNDVIHGRIYEVSLVLSGANPGAMIETVVRHSDDGEYTEEGIIHTGTLIHSSDDILEPKEGEVDNLKDKTEDKTETEAKTIGDVVDTMNDEQKEALYALVGMAAEGTDAEEGDDKAEEGDNKKEDDELVKHNVFNPGASTPAQQEEVLMHSLNEALEYAKDKEITLKEAMSHMVKNDESDTLQHGINSIELLFPEAQQIGGNEPQLIRNQHTAYQEILNGVKKSPFARVKSLWADLTEDEARAKGYITGNFKKEEFFSLIKRETYPTTIYKKQKLDRDDIVDITDFNVVSFLNKEMRFMLEEEIARAILVGDGREVEDEDKINEDRIIPIIKDNEFFTVRKTYTGVDDLPEVVLKAKKEYRGSGSPAMYMDPALLIDLKLRKKDNGEYLFGKVLTDAEIAAELGVTKIVETTWMEDKGILLVNLNDYQVGTNKGGEITNFDDFDIDFNQYKYLTETRLSGALVQPKSAFHFAPTGVHETGLTDEEARLHFGDRMADRLAAEDPEAGE